MWLLKCINLKYSHNSNRPTLFPTEFYTNSCSLYTHEAFSDPVINYLYSSCTLNLKNFLSTSSSPVEWTVYVEEQTRLCSPSSFTSWLRIHSSHVPGFSWVRWGVESRCTRWEGVSSSTYTLITSDLIEAMIPL